MAESVETVKALALGSVSAMYDNFNPELCYVRLEDLPKSAWDFSSILFKSFIVNKNYKKDMREFLKQRKISRAKRKLDQDLKDTGKLSGSGVNEFSIDFEDPKVKEAVGRLNACLTESNCNQLTKIFGMKDLTEEAIVTGLGVHLIKKLSGGAFTSRDHGNSTCPCGCGEKLESTEMYIGSETTWHGELDLLSGNKATNIHVARQPTDEASESDEELEDNDSPENHSSLEVKNDPIYSGNCLCRILAQSIVFAWTEYNRHPDCSSCIPSVLLLNEKFAAFLYNPVNDELYATAGFVDLNPSGEDYSGIFSLWVFLNHRLFFCKEENGTENTEPSGFKENLPVEILAKYQLLEDYKRLIIVQRDKDELTLNQRMSCFFKKELK